MESMFVHVHVQMSFQMALLHLVITKALNQMIKQTN